MLYTLSAALAALMVVQSVLGLLFQEQYRDVEGIKATWFDNDGSRCCVAPRLVVALLISRGGSGGTSSMNHVVLSALTAFASVEGIVTTKAQAMVIRSSLGGLLVVGAVNALGGGYYRLSRAKGVPTEWLKGSPFPDYFVPSLILLVVVGGSLIVAAMAVFTGLRIARLMALAAGIVVLGWLAVQLVIIGFVSWMPPTTAIAGVLVLILGSLLPQSR